jgi:hypothetical protein
VLRGLDHFRVRVQQTASSSMDVFDYARIAGCRSTRCRRPHEQISGFSITESSGITRLVLDCYYCNPAHAMNANTATAAIRDKLRARVKSGGATLVERVSLSKTFSAMSASPVPANTETLY